ncbi:MAG: metallophosphoesterase [Candidatus Binatia bacterium]
MKIVSFGDVHMAISYMQKIAVELASADLLILSGDLTHFGGTTEVAQVIQAARGHCANVLALPGNVDKPEVIDFLRTEQVGLHGESRLLGEIGVFGCGGSNMTPFHTPLEYREEELGALLDRAYSGVMDAPIQVMVCHTPPHATLLDRLANGTPVGSPTVRDFIERHQPHLCITGHIHESSGVDFVGRTKILNAGPFAAGGYIVAWENQGALDAQLRFIE